MKFGRYQLEKYAGKASRHTCPACGERGEFTRYIDAETGEVLPAQYGRCNREVKCGYHLRPGSELQGVQFVPDAAKPKEPPIDFMPAHIWQPTLSVEARRANRLWQWLAKQFTEAEADRAFDAYRVGTSKAFGGGAAVFWQFDELGRCRSGKVMGYSPEKGRRIREPRPQIGWAHTLLRLDPYNFKSCLFGLHLAEANPHKSVCIVESEKTALVCSIDMPAHVWVATGGLSNLSYQRLYPLRRRNIVLYPDCGAYQKWADTALSIAIPMRLDATIEGLSGSVPQGFDMCDLVVALREARENDLFPNGYPKEWDA